jgi:thiol-disulfide isomerase/thioredoxin
MIESMQIRDDTASDALTQIITDDRLSFQTGQGWLFGSQGGIHYTSSKASAIQDVTYNLMNFGPLEAPLFFIMQRSYADFFPPDRDISPSDVQTALDLTLSEYEMYPDGGFSEASMGGFTGVSVGFSVGDFNSGRAIAVDAGREIVVAIAVYAEPAAVIDTLFASVQIAPLSPEELALPPEGLREGLSAPDFTTILLDGSPIALSDLRGQVVMLNFWATWCPPCREEMPAMQSMLEQYGNQSFTILAVNNQEQPGIIQPFLDELGLTMPIALDSLGFIESQYNIVSFPTSLFLDRDGVIYAVHLGPISAEQMESYIQQGLAE